MAATVPVARRHWHGCRHDGQVGSHGFWARHGTRGIFDRVSEEEDDRHLAVTAGGGKACNVLPEAG